MKLHDWCTRGRLGPLAEACKVRSDYLSRIARGTAKPSFDLAGKISAATGGMVTIEDLLGTLPEGAHWSQRSAEHEMLFAEELAAIPKRPMASATAVTRGAA